MATNKDIGRLRLVTRIWMGIGTELEKTGQPVWFSVFFALLLMFLSQLRLSAWIWNTYFIGVMPSPWICGTWGFVIFLTLGFFLQLRKYSSWRKLLRNRRKLERLQEEGIINEYTLEKAFQRLFVNVLLHNLGSIPKNKEDFNKLMNDKNFQKLLDEIEDHKSHNPNSSDKKTK